MTIVVTGGSGLIGTALAKALLAEGHTVITIDRFAPSFTHEHLYFINCDIVTSPLPYNILERTDAVIHLVGSTIARKWTKEVQEDIRNSRTESTKRIVESIASATSRPGVFICASAIGYYGDTGQNPADEQSTKGTGFLSDVVFEWESAGKAATDYGVRTVFLRTAPVLSRYGGMLKPYLSWIRKGIVPKITKQDPWMSWIHEEDIVQAYIFALKTSTLQGVVNACAPQPVKYREFISTLLQVFHRRIVLLVPAIFMKWKFGAFSAEADKNAQVLPQRLIDKGFVFSYPTLSEALKQIKNTK